jgi:hypothetical protein
MCMMVWLGSAQSLALSDAARARITEEPAGAAVRVHFTTPHVVRVGSHEGCGCGFASGWLLYQGVADVTEARALEGAMSEVERSDFEQEQTSRELLARIVVQARRGGPVELFACWDGDELGPALATEEHATADWIVSALEPFAERTAYRVRAR